MTAITKPFAAHLLPGKHPTLAELAERAILSTGALDSAHDHVWNALNDRRIDDQDAFRAKFFAVTGLTEELLAELLSQGVL